MTTSPRRRSANAGVTRWVLPIAAAALTMATPVATWWLVGPMDEEIPAGNQPDYMVRPFDVGPGVERALGLGSVILIVVTLLLLAWATLRRLLDPRWWSVLVPLLIIGGMVGWGWRVMTMAVFGANICGGIVIAFGSPVLVGLLLAAAERAHYLLCSGHRARASRPRNRED